MKKDYTDITLVIDRSGSMNSINRDMEGGLKTFIEEQKKVDGKCLLSYYSFDDRFEEHFVASDIQSISEIKIEPRGMTALLDAIGKSINNTIERFEKLTKTKKPKHVIFMIITDGQENSSREYTNELVKSLIEKQTKDSNWNFVYLGANQDAFSSGQSMGFSGATSMTYTADRAGITNMIGSTIRNVNSLRYGQVQSMSYNDQDRKDAASIK